MSDDQQPLLYRQVKSADKPLSANAAAERVGCDQKTARKYLEELVEAGRLYALRVNRKLSLYWDQPVIHLDDEEKGGTR